MKDQGNLLTYHFIMEKRYFETKDIYMAAYLLYKEYHLVDTYKEKKGVTLFIFEHDSFIDNHAMKFINNNGDICF